MIPGWMRAWFKFLKGLKRQPEDSPGFRLAVGVNVAVALVATGAQLDWPEFLWPCLGLTWVGMFVSHRLRHRNNWEIKAALSVLMIVALGNFFVGLARTSYDPREPLAELLMWLQALHSCDIPTRKDLSYSLMSALILMSVAAVLSIDYVFAAYLAVYFLTTVVALRWNMRSMLFERTGWKLPSGRRDASTSLRLSASILLAGTLVVFSMPRVQAFKIRALPMSWQMGISLPRSNQGEVQNPYYPPQLNKEKLSRGTTFNPDGYSGFNSVVDLQIRGRLNHRRVFQVRCNELTYFRGLTFDLYDGRFWSQSEEALRPIEIERPPLILASPTINSRDVVQIFYIDRPLSNLILFAPQAYQVYFPSQLLYLDRAGCLRAPFVLDEGIVYSVVSRQAQMDPYWLNRLPSKDPELRRLRRYTQLPPEISPRVKELALQLSQGKRSYFERANAIARHLQEGYKYDLDVPRFPEGAETVDHFLFEARQGYCEHFASAMTVLCRSLKMPTRYCTGYLPGSYNPFTGFREVYGDDAHAWVEVYLPGYGWMAFDPTPGATVAPDLTPPEAQERWLGQAILGYLLKQLGPHRQALSIGLLTVGLGFFALALRKALRARPHAIPPLTALLFQAYQLVGGGQPGWSPRRYARHYPYPGLVELVSLHERFSYGPESRPSAQDLAQARQSLKRLQREIREQKPGSGRLSIE